MHITSSDCHVARLYEHVVATNSTISFISLNFKAFLDLTFVTLLSSSIGRGVVQYY